MSTAPVWTEPEIAIAKPLWAKGVSVTKIAAALKEAGYKRSKNAVVGWVSRNAESQGLPARKTPDAPRRSKPEFSFGAGSSEPSPERKAGIGKAAIRKPRLLKGQTPADGVQITELPSKGCKYALTAMPPHRFCGRPAKDGEVYCAGHMVGIRAPNQPGNPHARKTAKDQGR